MQIQMDLFLKIITLKTAMDHWRRLNSYWFALIVINLIFKLIFKVNQARSNEAKLPLNLIKASKILAFEMENSAVNDIITILTLNLISL